MNPENKRKIKAKILEEIKKTLSSIQDYKILTKPIAPENAIGRVSRMDAINNKSVTELALRKAKEKLENLKIVQKEIQNENFGICLKCEKEIPLARLLIIPEARKCVNCA